MSRPVLPEEAAPPPGLGPVQSPLGDLLRHLEVSMWAEGVDPVAAQRVINRICLGSPDGSYSGEPYPVPGLPDLAPDVRRFRSVLAQRLAFARKDAGLSQGEAARWLSIARTSVSALENGRREVLAVELVLLSLLYNRPLRWFTTFPDIQEVKEDGRTGAAGGEHGGQDTPGGSD